MLTLKAPEEGSRSSEATVVHHLFTFGVVAYLVPEGSCCGWPFNEAFPCIEYYSMEALAEHALALRHQHLWC